MPTFCDIAGIRKLNVERDSGLSSVHIRLNRRQGRLECRSAAVLDGISIVPTLTGKGRQQMHDHLYWEFHETDMLGVRRGKWKLVVAQGKPSLYDLDNDPHEDNDLAAQHPDIVNQLVQKIYEDHTDSQLFPITLPQRP